MTAARASDLCFGTVDTWIAWALSDGSLHVTDATNAAVTGLQNRDASGWDEAVLAKLGIPAEMMPTIVDSAGCRRRSDRTSRARRPSPRSSATSRHHSSDRVACAAATRRSPSAPAACSTSCSTTRHRSSRSAASTGRSRSSRGATAAATFGAWKRSCSRRARTCSGSATISASSRAPTSRTSSPRRAPTAAASCSCPHRSVSARPLWDYGARAALFGLDAWHRPRRDRARGARRHRAPRRRPRGCRGGRQRDHDPARARRRRHDRQPHVRAGARRRDATTGRDLTGARSHRSGRRAARGHSPSVITRRSTSWPPRGSRARRSSPQVSSTATAGAMPSPVRATGSPSSPGSTSSPTPTRRRSS